MTAPTALRTWEKVLAMLLPRVRSRGYRELFGGGEMLFSCDQLQTMSERQLDGVVTEVVFGCLNDPLPYSSTSEGRRAVCEAMASRGFGLISLEKNFPGAFWIAGKPVGVGKPGSLVAFTNGDLKQICELGEVNLPRATAIAAVLAVQGVA